MTFPLFQKVGGKDRALSLVENATGKRPTRYAIAKWQSLKCLPAKIALPLIFECQRLGIATSEEDSRLN